MIITDRLFEIVRGLIRFAGAGFGSFLLLIGGTAYLVETHSWHKPVAYGLMLGLVSVINFILQQRFVFAERGPGSSINGRILRFLGTMLLFRGAEWLLFTVSIPFAPWHYTVTAGIVTVVSFFGKFAAYDRWVFRPPPREP